MYDVNGKRHNKKCVAHAIGCAVQNTQDLMKEALQGHLPANHDDPWELDTVDMGLTWLYCQDGTVSCTCDFYDQDWTSRPASFDCLTLGYAVMMINNNPDVTGRI